MCPDEPDVKHGITFAFSFLHPFCTSMELLPIIIYRFNSYVEPVHAVSCRTTGIGEIDPLRPFREQLHEHHHKRASRFKGYYKRMTFVERRSHSFQLDEYGQLQPDLAADTMTGKIVGYCVSPVSAEKTGKVKSLFVEPAYRSEGTGTVLVTRGITGMDSQGRSGDGYPWGDGNEAAWAFYRKSKFYPRMTVPEQIPDPYWCIPELSSIPPCI
jgi:GNAT superfamily N-acetyltransferase